VRLHKKNRARYYSEGGFPRSTFDTYQLLKVQKPEAMGELSLYFAKSA
jgi:hypothetical protein